MERGLTEEQRTHVETLRQAQEALPSELEPVVDALVGRIADKWTMTVLEVLGERGVVRFTQIVRSIPNISQKMLTQTLRRMERDGLVVRTVHPVIPPHVDYRLTALGMDLGMAFCAVWAWAARNIELVEDARRAYDALQGNSSEGPLQRTLLRR